ncbi:MAG TPA: ankyrin repeat domain-containing protein [Gemmatimonadaceae bacterium]|nr:ankyrin repeat domain-containing protein [Gemmatimonadaceae bacterium]
MPNRRLPVRPNLEQLRHQAKDLLRAAHDGDPSALADFAEFGPRAIDPAQATLADAQFVLARSYEAQSWPRLVHACELTDAIWRDDADAVRDLIVRHPELLHESALARPTSNWGPPMSYAANLGRDRLIDILLELGASDLEYAVGRATLQGKVETARRLHARLGSPRPRADSLGGPAYTLSVEGTALMLELGAPVVDADGRRLAPVDVVLESDSRNPAAKHAILEMYVAHGLALPDTPVMALHRGRIDLLERHLRRDRSLLQRTFAFSEIYPPELGCHDPVQATHGTPLGGTTMLHMCIDYDEMDIGRWLLDQGADVNARADVDGDGFGGHTPLFNTVVSQPAFWMNHHGGPFEAPFTELLLARGADPNVRASLRKQIHPGYFADPLREYRDVTPLSWGERFVFRKLVSEPAMQRIAAGGGHA